MTNVILRGRLDAGNPFCKVSVRKRAVRLSRALALTIAAVAAVMGAKAENALPAEYTRLLYVRSTGKQWIDTKVKLKNSYRVEMDFMPQSVPGDSSGILIYGARNGSAENLNFSAAWTSSTGFYADFYKNTSRRMAYKGMKADVRYYLTVDKEHTQLRQEGVAEPVAEDATSVGDEFETEQTCRLLSVNTTAKDGYANYAKFKGLLYAFRITDCVSGESVRDFVPCKLKDSGVVGLYDLHEGKFYPSEGTEAFSGPRLPDGYLRLPYIRSTGEQWINTGIKLKSTYQIELDFEPTSLTGNVAIFGVRNERADSLNISAAWTSSTKFFADFYKNTSRRLIYTGMAAGNRYHLTMNNKLTQLKQEGVAEPVAEKATPVVDEFETMRACHLLSVTTSEEDKMHDYAKLSGLLYGFRILDTNDAALVEMVPVRDGAGVCGLYDIVRDGFYGNSGSGAFVCDGDVVIDNETVTLDRFSALDDYCVGPSDNPSSLVLKGANPVLQNTRADVASKAIDCTSTTSTGTIGIFGCTKASNRRTSAAVYSVKIWKNGVLVHELVPCRRLSDGLGGLYDLVDQGGESGVQFLTNYYSAVNFTMPSKATGASPAPGYERLAWIKADREQIIDTGFVADSSTQIEVLFNLCEFDVDNVAVIGYSWAAQSWLFRVTSGKFNYYDDSKERDLGSPAKHTDYRVVITGSRVTLEPLAPVQPGSLATAFAFGNGIGDNGIGEQVKAMSVRFKPTGKGFAAAPIRSSSSQRGIALYGGTALEVSDENLDEDWRLIPLMYDAGGFAQTPLTAAKLAALEASATLPKGAKLAYDEEKKTLYCKRGKGLIIVFR